MRRMSFHMDIPYAGSFASAQFTDDNVAGSGPTTFRTISNLTIVHMTEADHWQYNIKKIFDRYEEKWIERMVRPVEELDRANQLDSILKKLSHPMFNPSASWISADIISPVDHEKIEAEVTSTIGISPSIFQSSITYLHQMYQSTVHTMFNLDEIIQGKLKRVNEFHTQLSTLPTLSIDLPATSTLQTSISHYTEQMLEASNIHEEYPKFIHTVGVFQNLRSLLKMSSAFQDKELRHPCTICMTEEIDMVIVPCGHTFCSSCSKKTRSACFICRTPIMQKQRIYL